MIAKTDLLRVDRRDPPAPGRRAVRVGRHDGAHGLDRRPPAVQGGRARCRAGPMLETRRADPAQGRRRDPARPRGARGAQRDRLPPGPLRAARPTTSPSTVKLNEGQFPPYEQVIPKENDKVVRGVARWRCWTRFERVAIMASDKTMGVRLALEKGRLSIESDNPDLGNAREEMDVDYKGAPVQVGLQRPLLHRRADRDRDARGEASSWRVSWTRRWCGRPTAATTSASSCRCGCEPAGAVACVRIRELRADGWRNLRAAAPGARAQRLTVFRAQRPGQDQPARGGLLPHRAALVPHQTRAEDLIALRRRAGGPAGGRGVERRRARARGWRSSCGHGRKQVRGRRQGVRGTATALRGAGRGAVRARGPAAAAGGAGRPAQLLDRAVYNVEPAVLRRGGRLPEGAQEPQRAAASAARCRRPTLLATYDEELARTGARLVMRRRALVAALAPRVRGCSWPCTPTCAAELRYRSHPRVEAAGDEAAVRAALLARAWSARGRWTCAGASPASAPTPTTWRSAWRAARCASTARGAAALAGAGAQAGRAGPPRGAAGRAAAAAARRRGQRARRSAPAHAVRDHRRPVRARRFITVDRSRPRSPRCPVGGRFRGARRSACVRRRCRAVTACDRAIRFTPRETDARYSEPLGFS